MTSIPLAVRLVLLALLGVAPGVALAGVVEQPYTVVVAAAVAGVAAVATSLVMRRALARPARVRSMAAVTAFVVGGELAVAAAVAAVAPRRGDASGFVHTTVDAITHGWSALVTSPIPADPSARMLVPVAMVVWAATAASVALVGRSAPPVVPLVPPIAAFVAASVVAGREQYHPVLVGCALAAVAAGFLATFRPRPDGRTRFAGSRTGARRRASARTTLVATFGSLALAVVGAAAFGPSLTFGRDAQPFDPRDRIDPPTVPSGAISPLELFASRQRTPAEPMFVIEADEPVITRLVALEQFDGARWTTSQPYRPSGAAIEPPDRGGTAGRSLTASIRVDGLDGPWLPVAGDPVRIEGVSFLIEPSSGSLLAASGGVLGASYRIESVLTAADIATLQSLPAATDDEAIAALELPPGMPPLLSEMATAATVGATTPLINAAMLQRYLRASFERDDDYTAGHSYGHLLRAFTQVGAGTEEQFASAFAVLGRAVGLPTRVVVGFNPGSPQADGTYRVTAGDARVWPEVKFAGVGWVAFDPSPPKAEADGLEVPIAPGGSQGLVVQQGDEVVPLEGPQPPPAAPPDDDGGRGVIVVVWSLVAAAGIAVAAGAATALAKRGRTRRRRSVADPTERVVGAWSDVLDRFAEIDRRDPRLRTVDELVDGPAAVSSSLTGMYRPVLRALYDGGECTPADADQAWRARDRFVRAARREVGPLRRVAWSVDPRPLLPGSPRPHHPRRARRDRARVDPTPLQHPRSST